MRRIHLSVLDVSLDGLAVVVVVVVAVVVGWMSKGPAKIAFLWPTRSVAPPPAVGWSPLVPARVSGGQRKTVVVHVCQERGTVEGKRLDLQ